MEYINEEHNIKLNVTAQYLDCVKGFPLQGKKNNDGYHNHFGITVSSTYGSETFDYYGSSHDCENGIKVLSDYDLLNALKCIVNDALCGETDFHEFCDELGYDDDSCTPYRIHKACAVTSGKLQNVITNQSDEWYTIVNDIAERE